MSKRDDIIKAVNICMGAVDTADCNKCPYRDDYGGFPRENSGVNSCVSKLLMDVFTMRNGARLPIVASSEDMPWVAHYVCPSCHIEIDRLDRFCRHCGQELDWESLA